MSKNYNVLLILVQFFYAGCTLVDVNNKPNTEKYLLQGMEDRLSSIEINNDLPPLSLDQTIEDIGENPFPASIRVYFKSKNREKIKEFIKKIRGHKLIKEIKTNLPLIDKLKGVQKIIIITGLFFGSILLFTSFFTIVNIIKIVAFSRKEEVSIMKMVGASNFYIETPLILNGVILGVVGAFISILLFEITLAILPYYLKGFYDFIKPIIGIDKLSVKYYFYLTITAGLVGGFSSYTSVSKFLRKEE